MGNDDINVHTGEQTKLSKSLYLTGLECGLKLWFLFKRPDLIPETTPDELHRMEEGIEIGRLACGLYPGGERIETREASFEESTTQTMTLMEDENIPAIFEASFEYDNLRIRVDILRRAENGKWDIIEVKSSTGVKDEHYYDVGFQYMILKSLGVEVDKMALMHLSSDYVYDGGDHDFDKLFKLDDVTDKVVEREATLVQNLELSRKAIASVEPPEANISTHCRACIFFERCPHHNVEYPTLLLPRISKSKYEELRADGVEDIRQVPAGFELSGKQKIVWENTVKESEYIGAYMNDELNRVEYPVYYLDFESFGSALPLYTGTRPYQQIVFQWSCHVQKEAGGSLEHYEFLNDNADDPREAFIKSLLDCLGDRGTIVHYAPFEKSRLNDLARDLPGYAERIEPLIVRLWDLYQVVYKHYYHYKMRGSYSIKKVLPVLVPELSYNDLNIQEGGMASLGYLHLINPDTDSETRAGIRQSLLDYCGRDTLAMVEIYRILKEKAGGGG